jgi:hypothetical protein
VARLMTREIVRKTRPYLPGMASNTLDGGRVHSRTTEAFVLHLAALRPLRDNG